MPGSASVVQAIANDNAHLRKIDKAGLGFYLWDSRLWPASSLYKPSARTEVTAVMENVGPEQLGRLLDEYGPPLVLYARQWCWAPEDVVQEAFIQLARQAVPPDKVAAWLYRVVRNGAISASRSARRRKRYEAAAAQQAGAWFEAVEGDRLDAALAAKSLESLPAEQREVIVARLWGGLSFQEIGELVGTSSSSAHRWYEAGLTALRERLEKNASTRNT